MYNKYKICCLYVFFFPSQVDTKFNFVSRQLVDTLPVMHMLKNVKSRALIFTKQFATKKGITIGLDHVAYIII